MTARKAPASPRARAAHLRPTLLSVVQKTESSLAPVTAPVVSHTAPIPENHRGPPRRGRTDTERHRGASHTHRRADPTPILVGPEEAGPSALETQLLASLERDAERKGTMAEPAPKPSPHVYFDKERDEESPLERLYPYGTRRRPQPHTVAPEVWQMHEHNTLPVMETWSASAVRPLRVSFGVTWEWHASPMWPTAPDASLARLGIVAHECVYDALLYQLDSVDRPARHCQPWTVARSVLVWMPQSLLWWLYRRLPSPSYARSQHTLNYPVWIAPMDAPQRTGQWHLAALTLPIMLLWRADVLVAALLELLFIMTQLTLSVVAWGQAGWRRR